MPAGIAPIIAGAGSRPQVAREWLPSRSVAMRINVDATRRGNVARFFNHRCDGATVKLEIVHRTGEWLPVVALVTTRDVAEGEELAWTYGERPGPGLLPALLQACHCGSATCAGVMPLRPR